MNQLDMERVLESAGVPYHPNHRLLAAEEFLDLTGGRLDLVSREWHRTTMEEWTRLRTYTIEGVRVRLDVPGYFRMRYGVVLEEDRGITLDHGGSVQPLELIVVRVEAQRW